MLRRFDILDLKTDELIFSGVGQNAQEVYESWRIMDLRPLEYPKPEDLESEDPNVRLKALLLLNSNEDSWIEDDEIKMRFVRLEPGTVIPFQLRDRDRKRRAPNKKMVLS